MSSGASTRVRPPAVAGSFYPAAPRLLGDVVDELLTAARATGNGGAPAADHPPRAVIVPHAGYVYSGPVAASAYARIDATATRRVVVLGPSHRTPLHGLAVPSVDGLVTPLGTVGVDAQARQALVERGLATVDDRAHATEHSLEVQLPFLQHVVPGVPVLPIAVGRIDPDTVAAAIEMLWDDTTLVVVSTDLSHYEPYEAGRAHDARTAAAIVSLDGNGLDGYDACGVHALRGLLVAAGRRGLTPRVLDLRSSGDTAGPRDEVVGYGAFAIEAA